MKLTVVLQKLDGTNTEIEVDSDVLAPHAIVTHGGAHFLYRGYIGGGYTSVAFCEVGPPFSLDPSDIPPVVMSTGSGKTLCPQIIGRGKRALPEGGDDD
uniref:Uncharacterized protein n=1 Tax=Pseudomonas phage Pavpe01 TaxID=3138545 RepID=A0AAU6W156_9VIRU